MLAQVDSYGGYRSVAPGFLYMGLGQSQSDVTQKIEQTVASAGVSVGGAAAGAAVSGAAIGGAVATAAIGAGIGAVAIGIVAWLNRKGPAQNVATTKIADEIGPLMAQNLAAYQSGPHTRASQLVALDNYDKLWNYLVTACLTPALGNPGKSCVDDRKRGACHWKNDGKGGPAGSGSVCWNWFVGYRDPIANDPNVVDTPASSQVVSALSSGAATIEQLVASASAGSWGPKAVLGLAVVLIMVAAVAS